MASQIISKWGTCTGAIGRKVWKYQRSQSTDKQNNRQKKKDKTLHRKLKIKQHVPHKKKGVYSTASESVRVMVFNATFNNISVISNQLFLLVEKTIDLLQVTDKLLSHNVVVSTPRHKGFELTFVVMGTDCIGSCKSNYHMIMLTVPLQKGNPFLLH